MRFALVFGVVASVSLACETTRDDGPELDAGFDGDAASTDVVYVVAGASPNGDGTVNRPWASFTEAAARVAAGNVRVMLSPGIHAIATTLDLGANVVLEGAGVAFTTLQGSTVVSSGTGFDLRALSLEGSFDLRGSDAVAADIGLRSDALLRSENSMFRLSGLRGDAGSDVVLEGVRTLDVGDVVLASGTLTIRFVDDARVANVAITDSAGIALDVEGSTAALVDVSISDTVAAADDGDGASGSGARFTNSATEATDLRILRSQTHGLLVDGGVFVADSLQIEGAGRTCASALRGAQLQLVEPLLREAGTLLLVSDAEATVIDGTLRDAGTLCVAVSQGGRLTASGGLISRCPAGAVTFLEDSAGSVLGVILEETVEAGCIGIADTAGGVSVSQSTLRRCAGSGISVFRSTGVALSENSVVEISADPVSAAATGGMIFVDSAVDVFNNEISDIDGVGVSFLQTRGRVDSTRIERVEGVGLRVVGAAPGATGGTETVVLQNNVVRSALGAGVFVADAAVRVEGNEISSTRYAALDGLGDGIVFGSGSNVELTSNVVVDSSQHGITVFGAAVGTVTRNTVTASGGWGLIEYCLDGEASPSLVLSDNTFDANTLGASSRCSE